MRRNFSSLLTRRGRYHPQPVSRSLYLGGKIHKWPEQCACDTLFRIRWPQEVIRRGQKMRRRRRRRRRQDKKAKESGDGIFATTFHMDWAWEEKPGRRPLIYEFSLFRSKRHMCESKNMGAWTLHWSFDNSRTAKSRKKTRAKLQPI